MPRHPQTDPLELIERRWSPQVLVRLLDGPERFSQLAADIPGVSRRMLAERLRKLEAAGLVVRLVDDGPPTTITYSLAEEPGDLLLALRSLRALGCSRWG